MILNFAVFSSYFGSIVPDSSHSQVSLAPSCFYASLLYSSLFLLHLLLCFLVIIMENIKIFTENIINKLYGGDSPLLLIYENPYVSNVNQILCSFGTCNISEVLNFSNFSLAKMTYVTTTTFLHGFLHLLLNHKLGIHPQPNSLCPHLNDQCRANDNCFKLNLIISVRKLKRHGYLNNHVNFVL